MGRAVVDLETASLEESELSLRDRPMRDAAQQISEYFHDQGWGRVSLDMSMADAGVLELEVQASALASVGEEGQQNCHLIAGMLEAVLSHLAGRRLHVLEMSCAAMSGHERCAMAVVGKSRRAHVSTLIAGGATTTAQLITKMESNATREPRD